LQESATKQFFFEADSWNGSKPLHFIFFSILTAMGTAMGIFLMESKVCSRCLVEKSTILFNKDGASRDGYTSMCKSCNRDNCRAHYRKNIKQHRLLARGYYLEHKEKRKAYAQANKEKIQFYLKKYRTANREYLREMARANKLMIQAKLRRKSNIDKNLEAEDVQLKLIDV
jgi:hypothetical protein